MRELWDEKVNRLIESSGADVDMTPSEETGKPVISAGLKVRHKKSNLLYTVDSVNSAEVVLKTPEGDKFLLDAGEFEDSYAVD